MVATYSIASRGDCPEVLDSLGMVQIPDPQVPVMAKRRSFTKAYKLDILRQYEVASPAERAALMRREGLYSSHICEWRKLRDADALRGEVKRGRPASDPRDARIAKLERDNARLAGQLVRAETVIDVQKKLASLLGVDPLTGESL